MNAKTGDDFEFIVETSEERKRKFLDALRRSWDKDRDETRDERQKRTYKEALREHEDESLRRRRGF